MDQFSKPGGGLFLISVLLNPVTHKTLKGYWIKLAMIGYLPAQDILEKFA